MKKLLSIALSVSMIFSLAFGLNITAKASEIYNIQVKGVCDYTKANEILNIVNQRRSENGLSALTMDTELLNAAMDRAMETGIYYSHTRPNGDSCFTILSKLNGENIAVNYQSSESVMTGWMNSSGHRANILSTNFKSIGIGCFKSNSVYYWVQSFSNRSAESVPNKSGTVEKTNTVAIQKSLVTLYARTVKSRANAGYMSVNETGYFNYGIVNQGWSSTYCPGVASDYKFSSSDTSVISIDSNGKFTAVGEGTAKVSVQLKADQSKSYSEEIAVRSGNSVTNTPSNQTKTTNNQTKTTASYTIQTKTKSPTNPTHSTISFTFPTKSTRPSNNLSTNITKATKTTEPSKSPNQITKPSTKLAQVTKLTVKAKGKKLIIRWEKVDNATGYKVQVSKNKKFKKKIIFNKLTKKTKVIVKGKKIKRGKTYYVRVRAYNTANGNNNYGKWSKVVKKKVKKK